MAFSITDEYNRYLDMWEFDNSSPEIWDVRAGDWIDKLGKDGSGNPGMITRAKDIVKYLLEGGIIHENATVVDIGCGPGLLVTEFAKNTRHATGMDYAQDFLDYAANYASLNGVKNVSFEQCDFLTLDIDKAEFTSAFDLVFTSITPAASGKGCLDKLMRMSRKFCYDTSFVHMSDDLTEQISRNVFGADFKPRFDGTGFYALVNLLWLDGYYPETAYYDDTRTEILVPDRKTAEKFAARCGYESEGATNKVLQYLEDYDGQLVRRVINRYGSVLWDVTRRDKR